MACYLWFAVPHFTKLRIRNPCFGFRRSFRGRRDAGVQHDLHAVQRPRHRRRRGAGAERHPNREVADVEQRVGALRGAHRARSLRGRNQSTWKDLRRAETRCTGVCTERSRDTESYSITNATGGSTAASESRGKRAPPPGGWILGGVKMYRTSGSTGLILYI